MNTIILCLLAAAMVTAAGDPEDKAADADRGVLIESVIAVVGGEVVTRSELGDAIAFRASLLKAREKAGVPAPEIEKQFHALQEEIRDNLVENRLIVLAARADGMSGEEEVRKRMEKLKTSLDNDQEKLKAYAAQQGFTSLDEFEKQMQEEYLRQRVVFTQVRPKAEVGDKELEEAYKSRYGGKKAADALCQGAWVRVFTLEQVRFPLPAQTSVATLIDSYAAAFRCYLALARADFVIQDAPARCADRGDVQWGSLGEVDETKSFEKSFQTAFDELVADPAKAWSEPFILNDAIWLLHVSAAHQECFTDATEIGHLKDRLRGRIEEEKFERALRWWLKQLRGRFRVELMPL